MVEPFAVRVQQRGYGEQDKTLVVPSLEGACRSTVEEFCLIM
jgi:hypothetical protein